MFNAKIFLQHTQRYAIHRGAIIVAASTFGSITAAALCNASVSPSPTKTSPMPVVYQYQICPFCHRVKALLDHLKIPYDSGGQSSDKERD
jgi:hypothetical protein